MAKKKTQVKKKPVVQRRKRRVVKPDVKVLQAIAKNDMIPTISEQMSLERFLLNHKVKIQLEGVVASRVAKVWAEEFQGTSIPTEYLALLRTVWDIRKVQVQWVRDVRWYLEPGEYSYLMRTIRASYKLAEAALLRQIQLVPHVRARKGRRVLDRTIPPESPLMVLLANLASDPRTRI